MNAPIYHTNCEHPLGTVIPQDLWNTFSVNIPLLFHRIKQKLNLAGFFSWFGRKRWRWIFYLCFLQALSIQILSLFTIYLARTFTHFLYAHKPQRLIFVVPWLKKNPWQHCSPWYILLPSSMSCIHLSRVIDWCCHSPPLKQWVAIEQAAITIPLTLLPWCPDRVPHAIKAHPTIETTLFYIGEPSLLTWNGRPTFLRTNTLLAL